MYEAGRWICAFLGGGWNGSGVDPAEYICGSAVYYSVYPCRLQFVLLLGGKEEAAI